MIDDNGVVVRVYRLQIVQVQQVDGDHHHRRRANYRVHVIHDLRRGRGDADV